MRMTWQHSYNVCCDFIKRYGPFSLTSQHFVFVLQTQFMYWVHWKSEEWIINRDNRKKIRKIRRDEMRWEKIKEILLLCIIMYYQESWTHKTKQNKGTDTTKLSSTRERCHGTRSDVTARSLVLCLHWTDHASALSSQHSPPCVMMSRKGCAICTYVCVCVCVTFGVICCGIINVYTKTKPHKGKHRYNEAEREKLNDVTARSCVLCPHWTDHASALSSQHSPSLCERKQYIVCGKKVGKR